MPYDPEDPRLTAYALGELEDGEIEEIERVLSESAEGRQFIDEVRDTARLLSETLARESAPGLSTKHLQAIDFELAPAPSFAKGASQTVRTWQHWAGYGIAASLLMGFGLSAAWMVVESHRPAYRTPGELAIAPRSALPSPVAAKSLNAPFHYTPPDGEQSRPSPEAVELQSGSGSRGLDRLDIAASSAPMLPGLNPGTTGKPQDLAFGAQVPQAPAADFSTKTHYALTPNAATSLAPETNDRFYKEAAGAAANKLGEASSRTLSVTPFRSNGGLGPDVMHDQPVPGAPGGGAAGAMMGRADVAMRRRGGTVSQGLGVSKPNNAGFVRGARAGLSLGTKPGTDPKGPGQAQDKPGADPQGSFEKLYARAGETNARGEARSEGMEQKPVVESMARLKKAESEVARIEQLAKRAAIPAQQVKDAKDELSLAQKSVTELAAVKAQFGDLADEAKQKGVEEGLLEREVAMQAPVMDADDQVGAEGYNDFKDNTFQSASAAPLSTFSIDVDTASYSNIRRFLRDGNRLPPRGAVRLEEMVNYFPYDYPAPTNTTPDAPPFSVNVELTRCPWNAENRLAKIGLKGKVDAKRSVSNLVFLIDVSGSMDEPNKLPYVQASMRMLTEQLGENDRVSIIVYAGSAGLVLDSVGGYDKPKIAEAIDRLKAGGSTAGGAGIELAYKVAQKNFVNGGVNRVILATDGDFNVGVSDDKALEALAAEKAKTGVFLTVLGFGMGNLKDSKLKGFADKGNGNYAYIDNLPEARKVLVDQIGSTLVTVAKDVKIQVDFNAAQVGSYRLLGYENRMLETRDFNDDRKDAGEIGAGHTVTALYELTPPGKDLASNEPESKYAKAKAKVNPGDPGSKELFTVKLRYKPVDGDTSKLIEHPVTDPGKDFAQASEDFKFASSVAAFGMILRDNKDKGTATMGGLLEWAESSKTKDLGGYRKEFCDLVRKAKTLSEAGGK